METPQGVKVVFQHYYINPAKTSPAAQEILSDFRQKLSEITSRKDFAQWIQEHDPNLLAAYFSFLEPFFDMAFDVSQLPDLTDQVNAIHAALRVVGDVMVSKIAKFRTGVAQRDAAKELASQLLSIPNRLAYMASEIKGESEENVRLFRSQLHTLNAVYTLKWAAEMTSPDAQRTLLAASAITLYRLVEEVDQTHYPELISQVAELLTPVVQNNPKLLEIIKESAFKPLVGFVMDLVSGEEVGKGRVVAPAILQAICLKLGAVQAKSYEELKDEFLRAYEASGDDSHERLRKQKDLSLLTTALAHYYTTRDAEFIKGFLADYNIYERAYLLPYVLWGVGFDENLFASGSFDDLAVSLAPGGIIGGASTLARALADLEGKVPPTSPYHEKIVVLRALAELFSAQGKVSEDVKAELLKVEPPPPPSVEFREPLKSAEGVSPQEINGKVLDALHRKMKVAPDLAFVDPFAFGLKSMGKELELRAASAKEVAERLGDSQEFLSEFAKSALNLNPFGKVDKETALTVVQLLTEAFYDKWGHTSTGDPFMVAMQLAAAHEFGLRQSAQHFQNFLTHSEGKSFDWQGGCYIYNTIGHVLRGILRTIYNRTQEILAREGINEVAVYRGLSLPKGRVKRGKTAQVTHFPLSSWSFNLYEAEEFARRNSKSSKGLEGVVFFSVIPRERIFAISGLTGGGCAKELEVIALGCGEGNDKTFVLGY